MRFLRRHKYILIALTVYWPLVFVLTHIPVPDIARKSGLGDKLMHTLAYFMLTFLVWCAVSPYQRVQWRRAKMWWVIGAMAVYGAIDESLQGFVGRSPAVSDYLANLLGIALAMGLLSVFEFWSALLITAMACVFVISNLSNLPLLYPQFHLNTVFHFTAYAGLTLIWIQHLERYLPLRCNRAMWLAVALSLPVAMLAVVSISGPWFGKTIWWTDVVTAAVGIVGAVLSSWLSFFVSLKR
ncbi:MAG: VanZ family protein [Planctomycetes bacterium]|nr:VanZ family protein [Planctomycetota bacterium]